MTLTMVDRFWSKVDKSGDCWLWTASRSVKGYGRFSNEGRRHQANRVAYEMAHGPIPDGMLVCHHCDNPPCVRPDHLFLGSHAENMLDMSTKGRRSGARATRTRLTEANVRWIRECHAVLGSGATELADVLGVPYYTVYDVIRRRTWKTI